MIDERFDIAGLRARLKFTQRQLADELGLERSSISRMENGGEISGPVLKLLKMMDAASDGGDLPSASSLPEGGEAPPGTSNDSAQAPSCLQNASGGACLGDPMDREGEGA